MLEDEAVLEVEVGFSEVEVGFSEVEVEMIDEDETLLLLLTS